MKPTQISAAAFLFIIFHACQAKAQDIPYGDNPPAGHYLAMDDGTQIYYEVYGSGRPLVLLHSGLYGDIAEFTKLIPVLERSFQVIAIDTRGHGKSWIGSQPFSYQLFSSDAYSVITSLTKDSVVVVGISDGAATGLQLTVHHPELVRKLVYIGGNQPAPPDNPGGFEKLGHFNGDSLAKSDPGFVYGRKQLMPEPDRWDEFVEKLKRAWADWPAVGAAQLGMIRCPVLVAGGDRDKGNPASQFTDAYQDIPGASLKIIPGTGHIDLERQPGQMAEIITSFVLNMHFLFDKPLHK